MRVFDDESERYLRRLQIVDVATMAFAMLIAAAGVVYGGLWLLGLVDLP